MRFALWFLGLFALASALALFVGDNAGVVSLFWPPHRIDLSVNLALLILLLLAALIWFCARTLGALLSLPGAARRWRALQRERAMSQHLVDALANLLAGRFLRARKQALAVLTHREFLEGQVPVESLSPMVALTHMLLAEAAHALQDRGLRDRHVALAHHNAGPPRAGNLMGEAVQMQAARWALEDRDARRAVQMLDELPAAVGRRTLALRWRLRAYRRLGDADGALGAGRLLTKHHAFDPQAADAILRSLVIASLSRSSDTALLERVWRRLDPAERLWPEVAATAAQRWMALGGSRTRASEWLQPAWDAALIANSGAVETERLVSMIEAVLACLANATAGDTSSGDEAAAALGKAWLARIEAAQRRWPADGVLRFAAGMACHAQGLWGLSQQLLRASVAGASLPAPCRAQAWRALADMAERRGDPAEALHAWRQAAQPH